MLDIVKLRNVGDTAYIAKHDRYGEIVVEPGKDRIVPLAVALVCFGNPGARNMRNNPLRDLELRHIKLYHGFAEGLQPDSDWEESVCPKIEVYDVETDERIWMVHDDPTGEKASADLGAAVADATNPEAILARHRAEHEQRLTEAIDGIEEHPDSGLTQAERNAIRDDIPKPADDELAPTKDKPRTTRGGSRSTGTRVRR